MATETWPCDICLEDREYFLICPFCQKDACTDCYERVFDRIDLNCMHCRKSMTRDYVIKQMGVDWFHTKYMDHLVQCSMQQQYEALPHTQAIMEALEHAASVYEKRILGKRSVAQSMQWEQEYYPLLLDALELIAPGVFHRDGTQEHMTKTFNSIVKKLDYTTKCVKDWDLMDYMYMVQPAERTSTKPKKQKITGKCPTTDCRGFLVGTTCGICATRVCPACRVTLTADISHVCLRENIEAIELIQRETKPCPQCYAPISKISGCDQMWCVCCQTTFSWNTGAVEKGAIHNPHYYEWRRRNGVGDDPIARACDPAQQMLYTLDRLYLFIEDDPDTFYCLRAFVPEIEHMIQSVTHLEGVTRTEYEKKLSTGVMFIDLRMQYMRGDIDDAVWRRKLQRILINDMRYRGLIELINTWTQTIRDLVGQVAPHEAEKTISFVRDIIVQYRAFLDYLNEICNDLSIMYRFKIPVLVDMIPAIRVQRRVFGKMPPELQNLKPFPSAYTKWA